MSPILEGVIAGLMALGHSEWERIAKATKVSKHTIRKIAYRDRKNPSIHTIERLRAYLEARQ